VNRPVTGNTFVTTPITPKENRINSRVSLLLVVVTYIS